MKYIYLFLFSWMFFLGAKNWNELTIFWKVVYITGSALWWRNYEHAR